MVAYTLDSGISRIDFVVPQGSDVTLTVPILDATGAPQTVTGWTAKAQVKRRVNDATVYYEWNTTAGVAVAQCVGTNLLLKIPASVSLLWAWRTGVWDAVVTSPDPTVSRPAGGLIRVQPIVTR